MKDIYVQFRGKYKVDGESRDSEHKDWLEVSADAQYPSAKICNIFKRRWSIPLNVLLQISYSLKI